jgi:hypothetical protein
MQVQISQEFYTAEEYLQLEETSELKNEYYRWANSTYDGWNYKS